MADVADEAGARSAARALDAGLAARVRAGDGRALIELYDRHGRSAWALVRRICADERLAADVVQEAFLAFWRDPGTYDAGRRAFSTWLLTVVHHRAVDAVRREGGIRRRTVPAEGAEDTTVPGADQQALGAVVAGRVRTALGRLPRQEWQALALAYFGGYTQREVAALTGVPLGTVKSRTFTGLARLRSVVGPVTGSEGAGG